MRVRISATPPPTAVELMFWMVLPLSWVARTTSSSIVSCPTTSAYCSNLFIAAYAFDNCFPQPFECPCVRIELRQFAGQISVAELGCPLGKIVLRLAKLEPRVEHVIAERVDAYSLERLSE